MSDAIAVLNAGSSSIKFSLFVLRTSALELELRGQIEGIYTAPHFVAKDSQRQASRRRNPGGRAPSLAMPARSTIW